MRNLEGTDLLSIYKKINARFKKRLVYKFDYNENFYSELNNMILTILYCLEHEIQFNLYSKDGIFSTKDGWVDYFEPFCNDEKHKFHSKYNHKRPNDITNSLFGIIRIALHKDFNELDYCTHDILPTCRINYGGIDKTLYLPHIDGYQSIREALSTISNMIYCYNSKTSSRISHLINRIGLPERYAGLHLSGGDYSEKFKQHNLTEYMDIIKSNTNLTDIFVMTDDHAQLKRLKINFPEYNFYSNCDEKDNGDFMQKLSQLPKFGHYVEYLKLLSSIEILRRASLAVVPFNTHPGMFLGMNDTKSKIIGIDRPSWVII